MKFTIDQYKSIERFTRSKTYKWMSYIAWINFILSIILVWDKGSFLKFISYIWIPLLLFIILLYIIKWTTNELTKMKKEQVEDY